MWQSLDLNSGLSDSQGHAIPREFKLFLVVGLFLKKEQSQMANPALEGPGEDPSSGTRWAVCFILSVKAWVGTEEAFHPG